MPDGYSALADRIQKGLIGYGEAKRGLAREGLAGAKMQYDIAGEETRRTREAEKYKLERPGLQLQQQQKKAELKAYNSPINISEMVQDKVMTKEALPAVSRLVNLSNKMFGTEYRDGLLLKPGLEGARESLTIREFHEGGGTEALAAIITQDQEPRSDTVEGHQEILRILQRGKGILVSVGAPEEYIKSMDSAIGRTDKRIETLRKKPKLTGDIGEYYELYGKKPTTQQLLTYRTEKGKAGRAPEKTLERIGAEAAAGRKPEDRLRMEAKVKAEEAAKVPPFKIGATKERLIAKKAKGEAWDAGEQQAWDLLSTEDKMIGQAMIQLLGKNIYYQEEPDQMKKRQMEKETEDTVRRIFGLKERPKKVPYQFEEEPEGTIEGKYETADDVRDAYRLGELTKESAAKILREQFGHK